MLISRLAVSLKLRAPIARRKRAAICHLQGATSTSKTLATVGRRSSNEHQLWAFSLSVWHCLASWRVAFFAAGDSECVFFFVKWAANWPKSGQKPQGQRAAGAQVERPKQTSVHCGEGLLGEGVSRAACVMFINRAPASCVLRRALRPGAAPRGSRARPRGSSGAALLHCCSKGAPLH